MTCNRPGMDCHVAALLAVTDFLGRCEPHREGFFGVAAHFAVTDFSGRGTPLRVGFLEGDARHALPWRC
jgi:hypothetical protein